MNNNNNNNNNAREENARKQTATESLRMGTRGNTRKKT
jgi:hypothetical protein